MPWCFRTTMNEMKKQSTSPEKSRDQVLQSQPTVIKVNTCANHYWMVYQERRINTTFLPDCRVQNDTARTGGFKTQ